MIMIIHQDICVQANPITLDHCRQQFDEMRAVAVIPKNSLPTNTTRRDVVPPALNVVPDRTRHAANLSNPHRNTSVLSIVHIRPHSPICLRRCYGWCLLLEATDHSVGRKLITGAAEGCQECSQDQDGPCVFHLL